MVSASTSPRRNPGPIATADATAVRIRWSCVGPDGVGAEVVGAEVVGA
jgi:hypothetical protein